MPSVSKSQQRLMGMAYAVKSGKKSLGDLPASVRSSVSRLQSMTKDQLRKFASTDHEGLPAKKESVPYSESDDIRTFDESVDIHELVWHRDREDRRVTVLESTGWKFQRDNELPRPMVPGQVLFIPEGQWHRVVKGRGPLKIKVEKFK